MLKRIVIASNNPGKLREIQAILAPLALEAVPQAALAIPEADEPHCTFVENALVKARHASRAARLPALADDSGICVDALNGEPGVRSARFAGEPRSDARNNEKLLTLLAGRTDRKAHYYCAIVLVRHADDPRPIVCDGEWHGEIALAPRGGGGFGYDPFFLLPEIGKTAAELAPEEKNRASHRAQALRALAVKLAQARNEERWAWSE